MVDELKGAWGMRVDPIERLKMEANLGISQQRRGVGHACGKMGKSGGRLDTKNDTAPFRKEDAMKALMKMMRQPAAR